MRKLLPLRGPLAFAVVCLGQTVSAFGSQLTAFSLAVWVLESTGSATQLGLITFFASVPNLVLLPVAGALVDRWDRRWAMILSDGGAGLCTLALALLAWAERLGTPYICLLVGLSSTVSAVRFPAFSASTVMLVGKKHLMRASGFGQTGAALAMTSAPAAAGALLHTVGLRGVILIDVCTFLFAVAGLLAVDIPRPVPEGELLRTGNEPKAGEEAGPLRIGKDKGSGWRALLREMLYGWSYIRERRGLVALLVLYAAINLSFGMVQVLVTPLVLAFASAVELGWIMSVAAGGTVFSTLGLGISGGPRLKLRAMSVCLLIQGLVLFLGGVRPNVALVAAAACVYLSCQPILYACYHTIWQSKVALSLQGRIFAVRRMLAASTVPLAPLLAGSLADLCEPLLLENGHLAGSVGRWIGVGPGRGVGFLFICVGFLLLVLAAVACVFRPLRDLEQEIPDAVADT